MLGFQVVLVASINIVFWYLSLFVWYKLTNVPEVLTASFIRAMIKANRWRQ
jgi:hypothetical protein